MNGVSRTMGKRMLIGLLGVLGAGNGVAGSAFIRALSGRMGLLR